MLVTKTRIIKEQIENLYQKWTTKEGLNSFFGEESNVKLKENGPFEIYFDMTVPKGTRGSEGCKIIDFRENEYIMFTWSVPPKFKARKQHYKSIVKLTFIQEDDENTHIILDNIYEKEIDELNDIVAFFEEAWDTVLDRLEYSVIKENGM